MTRTARDRFVHELHAQRRALHLTAGDVNVATALVHNYSDDDLRPVWPSQRTLADAAGISVRMVRYCLARLEAAQILTVERHSPRQIERGRWTRRTNRYRFMWKRLRAWGSKRVTPPKPKPNPASLQRAPSGNGLPHEPLQGVNETPVVPPRPPPGVVAAPIPPPDCSSPPRSAGANAAMAAARARLPGHRSVFGFGRKEGGP